LRRLITSSRWFRRRWVVQEVALAREAKIYCGTAKIAWKDFAVAVELFVEVETATHRLSEVIQKDERFYRVPNWFEYVSELGASLLVQATARVFRVPESRTLALGMPNKVPLATFRETNENTDDGPVDPLNRRGLLSLEHLVSTMSTFEAGEPRDTIYSLLAIARDTTPLAEMNNYRGIKSRDDLVMLTLSSFLERKPYNVDYNLPYSDVCRAFVQFCIERAMVLDQSKALDILCRPWAPPAPKEDKETAKRSKRKARKKGRPGGQGKATDPTDFRTRREKGIFDREGNQIRLWRTKEDKQEFHHRRLHGERQKTYKQARDLNLFEADTRTMDKYKEEFHDLGKKIHPWILKHIPRQDAGDNIDNAADAADEKASPAEVKPRKDIELPTWVASIEGAPFGVFEHPGMHRARTGRKNADPLVGHPQDGLRNYAAAQTQKPGAELEFRKRPVMGHYSLFVKGFKLDKVKEVSAPAYGGQIPKAWIDMAGWTDWSKDPPDEFLRTLVADRGGNGNRNPPHYYAKACRESVVKGSGQSGRVNIEGLINNEKNSIIAEFCRRVQSVIWNRRLIRTERGMLGLGSERVEPGDLVCVIYGCSVPVICREFDKISVKIPQLDHSGEEHQDSRASSEDEDVTDIIKTKLEDVLRNLDENQQTSAEELRTVLAKSKEDLQEVVDIASPKHKRRGTRSSMATWPVPGTSASSRTNRERDEYLKILLKSVMKDEMEEDKVEKAKAWIKKFEMKLVKKARYKELTQHGFNYKKVHFTGEEYQKYIGEMTRVTNEHLKSLEDIEMNAKISHLYSRIMLFKGVCEALKNTAAKLAEEKSGDPRTVWEVSQARQAQQKIKMSINALKVELARTEEKLESMKFPEAEFQSELSEQERSVMLMERQSLELKRVDISKRLEKEEQKAAFAAGKLEEAEAGDRETNQDLEDKTAKLQLAGDLAEKAKEKLQTMPRDIKLYGELGDIYKRLNNDDNAPKEERRGMYGPYYHKLMGEAYIHGMMDGDAIKERVQGGQKEWVFELR
jgi:hypothetical protein